VARIVYSACALDHLERAVGLLRAQDPRGAARAVHAIASAAESVATHPLIGQRIDGEIRELIISYGETGYVALYRFIVPRDEVHVLAIRHQRELGRLP